MAVKKAKNTLAASKAKKDKNLFSKTAEQLKLRKRLSMILMICSSR